MSALLHVMACWAVLCGAFGPFWALMPWQGGCSHENRIKMLTITKDFFLQ